MTRPIRNSEDRIKRMILCLLGVSVIILYACTPTNTIRQSRISKGSPLVVSDTFPCPQTNDSIVPPIHRVTTVTYPREKLNLHPNLNTLDVYDPLFFSDEAGRIVYSVKEIIKDSLVRREVISADIVSNSYTKNDSLLYEKDIVSISGNRIIYQKGSNFTIHDLKNNLVKEIHLPAQMKGFPMVSSSGNYIFSNNDFRLYRYDIAHSTMMTGLSDAGELRIGDCSRAGKILIPDISMSDDSATLDLFDSGLKLMAIFTVPKREKMILSFECVKFNPTNDEEFFYSLQNSIYKMDMRTRKITRITKGCANKQITTFTVSSDGQNLVAVIKIPNQASPGTCTRLMNLNLTNNTSKLVNARLD